jgi:hypothetical protein
MNDFRAEEVWEPQSIWVRPKWDEKGLVHCCPVASMTDQKCLRYCVNRYFACHDGGGPLAGDDSEGVPSLAGPRIPEGSITFRYAAPQRGLRWCLKGVC